MWAIQSPGPEELYKNATATELGRVQTDEGIAARLEDQEAEASKTPGRFLFLAWTPAAGSRGWRSPA